MNIITDINQVVEYLNNNVNWIENQSKYRILESDSSIKAITNVPVIMYEDLSYKKYSSPIEQNSSNNSEFIRLLQEAFDYFHNFLSTENEKLFRYNHCYENALAVFKSFENPGFKEKILVTSPEKICFGYISKKIKQRSLLNDLVIDIEDLVIHDWHVWNKINDFLIDLSIQKDVDFPIYDQSQLEWKEAQDHIFKDPPENIEYFGKDFVSVEEFQSLIKEVLNL